MTQAPRRLARNPGDDPRAWERTALDLSIAAFDHTVEGLRVIGTWLWDQDGNAQPALVILDPRRSPGAHAMLPTVPLADAWKWAEWTEDKDHLARSVVAFAEVLPVDIRSRRSCERLITAVRKRLADLVAMPPAPPRRRTVVGEMRAEAASGAVEEREITDAF